MCVKETAAVVGRLAQDRTGPMEQLASEGDSDRPSELTV